MHETMIAQNIFTAISDQAKKHKARPLKAKISCGQYNTINDEILSFAFEAAADNSICQGMKLEIIHIPLNAICQSCGENFEFDIYSPKCKKCGSEDFQMAPDAPILLEEIEFEDKEKI